MSLPFREIEHAMWNPGVVDINGHRLSIEVDEEGELIFSFKNDEGNDCITFLIRDNCFEIPNYYTVAEKKDCPDIPHDWFFAFIKELAVALKLDGVILDDGSSKEYNFCHVDKSILRIATGVFFYHRHGFIYEEELEAFFDILEKTTLLELALSFFREEDLSANINSGVLAEYNLLLTCLEAVAKLLTPLPFLHAFGDKTLRQCLTELCPSEQLQDLCRKLIDICKSNESQSEYAKAFLKLVHVLLYYSAKDQGVTLSQARATWKNERNVKRPKIKGGVRNTKRRSKNRRSHKKVNTVFPSRA